MWDGVAHASPAWLVLGVALHLLNQLARGLGWRAVGRAAAPVAPMRRRDTVAAWVAGAGAGGLVSARGGDALRVFLLGRRAPDVPWPTLAGTLVAEAVGELAVGGVLVAIALGMGTGPQLGAPGPEVFVALAVGVVAVGIALRRPRARAFAARAAGGCAVLGAPRGYACRVLPWQLASRAFRLAALACFLIAFGLPATPDAVVLVTFAQTGGRLIPFGPAAVGAGAAVLAATFGPVTGTAVTVDRVALFFVGTSTVLTVVGTVLTLAICLRAAPWRDVLAAAQASASTGRMTAALRGRRLARAAAAPRP